MDPIILHIETATKTCSIALSCGSKLLSFKETNDSEYSHSEKLNGFIEQVLAEAEITMKTLSAVSVSKGPGSFTGLRIGVSSAKGIAYALSIPIITCNTLDCLASGFKQKFSIGENDLIIPMIDARRLEVYMKVIDTHLNSIEDTQAKVVDATSFDSYLIGDRKIHLIGDGAFKFHSIFEKHPQINVHESFLPSAKYMLESSIVSFENKNFEDLAYFEPFYLKDFVAIKPRKIF
jgi:tRNA threonylcarbamoyladenosine biosynthesis protein TsaB